MAGFYKSYSSSMEPHATSHNWSLGAPTNPMVARQLEEFSKLLNQGIKNIEVGTISTDKFEQIPQQHFEEVRRLAKITDAKVSVHAPLIDLAGFPGQEGGRWREEQRQSTEQQVFSILERSHKLSNGENVPVVFHAGNTFSQEYGIPYDEKKHPEGLYKEEPIIENGKIVGKKKIPIKERLIVAINQETGEIAPLQYEKKNYIGKGEEVWDPEKRLESLNQTQWDQEKKKLLEYQKEIEDLKEKMIVKMKQNEAIGKTGLEANPEYKKVAEDNTLDILRMNRHIDEINKLLGSEYHNVYNKFVKFAKFESPEEKKKINEYLKKLDENYNETNKKIMQKNKELYLLDEMSKKTEDYEEKARLEKEREKAALDLFNLTQFQSKQVVTALAPLETPEIWEPVGKFAIEKTAETVAGAVAKLYEKLKKSGKEKETPFIALENFFVHTPMSTAEDLRKAVMESRKKLSKELMDRCKLSEKQADNEAERLIGATWDVGHINNLRKAGYEGEELKQKMIEEAKKIADVTKHVHITDNFGFFDSHLPPGMGNVPIKEIMEQLEKKWAEQYEAGRLHQKPRGIVEAGGFVAEIGQNPTLGIMEYFGSPLYKMSPSPYWKDISQGYPKYMESFIEFPSQHFNLYGSSFTTLPKAVGGQVGSEQSRFSGTPNQ